MSSARPRSRPKTTRAAPETPAKRPPLLDLVLAAMDDMKAVQVKVLNVVGLTDIADYMVIASGNSDRHVKSIAERVVQQAKAAGKRPLGVEGERDGEWVLVDLPDIMVHVMLPRVREFYALEELWDNTPAAAAAPAARPAANRSGAQRRPRKGATAPKRGVRRGHASPKSRKRNR